MFEYLILKLLCNIFQSLDVHDKKCFSGTTTPFGSRVAYLEIIFKVLRRKIVFYVFILSLLRKLVLPFLQLHDWFTLGALATDKNCIPTRYKVVSRKLLNNLKRKKSLWKALSKRQTGGSFLSPTLRNALQKSRRRFLHIWLTVKIKPRSYYVI